MPEKTRIPLRGWVRCKPFLPFGPDPNRFLAQGLVGDAITYISNKEGSNGDNGGDTFDRKNIFRIILWLDFLQKLA